MESRARRIGLGARRGALVAALAIVPTLLIGEASVLLGESLDGAIGYVPGISLLAIPALVVPALLIGGWLGALLASFVSRPRAAQRAPWVCGGIGVLLTVWIPLVSDMAVFWLLVPMLSVLGWLAGTAFAGHTVVERSDSPALAHLPPPPPLPSSTPSSLLHQVAPAPAQADYAPDVTEAAIFGALVGLLSLAAASTAVAATSSVFSILQLNSFALPRRISQVVDIVIGGAPLALGIGAFGGVLLVRQRRTDLVPWMSAGGALLFLVWRFNIASLDRLSAQALVSIVAASAVAWFVGQASVDRFEQRTGIGPASGSRHEAGMGGTRGDRTTPSRNDLPARFGVAAALVASLVIAYPIFVQPVLDGFDRRARTDAISQAGEEARQIIDRAGLVLGNPISTSRVHEHICAPGDDAAFGSAGRAIDTPDADSQIALLRVELEQRGFTVESGAFDIEDRPLAQNLVLAGVRDDTFVDAQLTATPRGGMLQVRVIAGQCVRDNQDRLVTSAMSPG